MDGLGFRCNWECLQKRRGRRRGQNRRGGSSQAAGNIEREDRIFQVSLADEQVKLYTDALALANAQYEDIKINARAGTKSLSDELQSHQEVLTRMKQLRQAKADMATALLDLSAITGEEYKSAEFENMDSMLLRFEPYFEVKVERESSQPCRLHEICRCGRIREARLGLGAVAETPILGEILA